REKFVDSTTIAFDFVELSGEDITVHDVSNVLDSIPFSKTGKGRVVVLRDIEELPVSEAQRIYLLTVPSSSVLIIMSKSSKKFETVKKFVIEKDSVFIREYSVSSDILKTWIKSRCTENGKEISGDAVRELLIRCSGDLFLLLSEIKKLALFIGDNKKIEKSDVEEIVEYTLEPKVFNLIDAIMERRKGVALKMFDELLTENKTADGMVLSMLLKTLSQVIFIKELMATTTSRSAFSTNSLSRRFGIKRFAVSKMLSFAKKNQMSQFLEAFHRLEEIDIKSKTGEVDRPLHIKLFIQNM
ncbi:MAG: DNA polymerase III subunit delta, partial [Caldisericota bacterium]|nr:DNA polymerase III subunit delta [Caldisericota bacterium]